MALTDKLTNIANAIRDKKKITYELSLDAMAEEIKDIDRLQPMTMYPDGYELDNGWLGNFAAQTAATYHFARFNGDEDFVYNANSSCFSNAEPRIRDTATRLTPIKQGDGTEKTDASTEGCARIDCSTYVGLALRGIPYEDSPYAWNPYDGQPDGSTWLPYNELPQIYEELEYNERREYEGWDFRWLDMQPEGQFNDIGFEGYSTIRTAADFGEFFFKNGKVLFDEKVEGVMTQDKINELLPQLKAGDLIFWASPGATENQQKRFRQISHIGIVAERTDKYFHVTNDGKSRQVVLYNNVNTAYAEMTLICRPNYTIGATRGIYPTSTNLLHYPWSYGFYKDYAKYEGGITVSLVPNYPDTLHVYGTATAATGISIRGDDSSDYNYIPLTPGVYELGGMENSGLAETASASLQLKCGSLTYNETDIKSRCAPVRFAITTTTKAYVRLYVPKGVTLDFQMIPRLRRIRDLTEGDYPANGGNNDNPIGPPSVLD